MLFESVFAYFLVALSAEGHTFVPHRHLVQCFELLRGRLSVTDLLSQSPNDLPRSSGLTPSTPDKLGM